MPDDQPEKRKPTGPDYSWLLSSQALRWKTWFYQGLVPFLLNRGGPVAAGESLEKLSDRFTRFWIPRKQELRRAIHTNMANCETGWDPATVETGLGRQLLRYVARDCVLDGAELNRYQDLFAIKGLEHLDQVRSEGRGYILLGSHLGGHLAAVHWLIKSGIDFRMLVQRPKHVSRDLDTWFASEMPIVSQHELFLKRDLSATEAARRMTDARRLIQRGIGLYLNCDIPWDGPNTDSYPFLGRDLQFQSIWIDLATILQCPIVIISCRQKPGGRFELTFDEPAMADRFDSRSAIFKWAVSRLEQRLIEYPDDAIAHLLWPIHHPGRSSK
jgi:lauroyl/myristoyl acyltransferase